eukprot:1304760-Prymnesium_polylepis.1
MKPALSTCRSAQPHSIPRTVAGLLVAVGSWVVKVEQGVDRVRWWPASVSQRDIFGGPAASTPQPPHVCAQKKLSIGCGPGTPCVHTCSGSAAIVVTVQIIVEPPASSIHVPDLVSARKIACPKFGQQPLAVLDTKKRTRSRIAIIDMSVLQPHALSQRYTHLLHWSGIARWRSWAGERSSNALTIGQLSAAQ